MRVGKESFRRLFSNRLIVITLVVLVLLAMLGLSYRLMGSESNVVLKAIPAADNTIGTLGLPIHFSSNASEGDIKSYHWDFGDGGTSTEGSPSNIYVLPGWYNVTLTVESDRNTRDNKTITIGVQQPDVHDERGNGRMRNIGRSPLISSLWVTIGPNIANPTITGSVNLLEVWGDGSIVVWVDIMGRRTKLYEDFFSSTSGGQYSQSYEISPDDIGELSPSIESNIVHEIRLNYGRLDVDSEDIRATFPREELQPPW